MYNFYGTVTKMVHQRITANPPHCLNLGGRIIIFTRIASHIYDLSLSSGDDKFHFLGRVEQKSDNLWAVTYIDCQPCMPEYFDDWRQATLFLSSLQGDNIADKEQ